MADNSFKVKNSLVLTPVSLTSLTNPQAGDLACDISDSNKIKRYDSSTSAWVEVGAGGGASTPAPTLIQESSLHNLKYQYAYPIYVNDAAVNSSGIIFVAGDGWGESDNDLYPEVNAQFNMRSTDGGITWSPLPRGVGAFQSVTSINNTFVAGGPQGIFTSTDGISWTSRSSAYTTSMYYLQNILLAFGVNLSTGVTTLLTSSDSGVTWITRTVPNISMVREADFGNGIFIALGDAGELKSLDGITWTSLTYTSPMTKIHDIAFGLGKFVCRATIGGIQKTTTTTDFISFTPGIQIFTPGGILANVYNFKYGGGFFLAYTDRQNDSTPYGLCYSTDGLTWRFINTSTVTTLNGLTKTLFTKDNFILISRFDDQSTTASKENSFSVITTGFKNQDLEYSTRAYAPTGSGIQTFLENADIGGSYQITFPGEFPLFYTLINPSINNSRTLFEKFITVTFSGTFTAGQNVSFSLTQNDSSSGLAATFTIPITGTRTYYLSFSGIGMGRINLFASSPVSTSYNCVILGRGL